MSEENKLFISKLDQAWSSYVHNQTIEIMKLWQVAEAAQELLNALSGKEVDALTVSAILILNKYISIAEKYHNWREKYDPRY